MRGRAFRSRNQFLEAAPSVKPSPALAESAETAGDPDGYKHQMGHSCESQLIEARLM